MKEYMQTRPDEFSLAPYADYTTKSHRHVGSWLVDKLQLCCYQVATSLLKARFLQLVETTSSN